MKYRGGEGRNIVKIGFLRVFAVFDVPTPRGFAGHLTLKAPKGKSSSGHLTLVSLRPGHLRGRFHRDTKISRGTLRVMRLGIPIPYGLPAVLKLVRFPHSFHKIKDPRQKGLKQAFKESLLFPEL